MGRKSTKSTLRAREETQAKFLETLAISCNVTLSAKSANIERTTAYKWRDEYPDFAAAWDSAIQEAIERLEYEAWQRARKQSDTLMIFLLKAHKPEKYRENINVKVETWETQAIEDIKAGRIEYEALVEAFDESLATELFRRAGVPITSE